MVNRCFGMLLVRAAIIVLFLAASVNAAQTSRKGLLATSGERSAIGAASLPSAAPAQNLQTAPKRKTLRHGYSGRRAISNSQNRSSLLQADGANASLPTEAPNSKAATDDEAPGQLSRVRLQRILERLLERAGGGAAASEASALRAAAAGSEEVKQQIAHAEQRGEAVLQAAQAVPSPLFHQVDEGNMWNASFRGSNSYADDEATTAARPDRSHRKLLGSIMGILPKDASLNGLHFFFIVLLLGAKCVMQPGRRKADQELDERQHPLFYVFASRNMRGTHSNLFDM
eukprot:TRINITY_DN101041_c0_g1_i1.p1 TRINITY_DN101041_c0_g1~~TRINITY_DN101041_c0_g1_i1.p1  ORF type:complete len:286 (+),score=57.79 TRINITY_DN101041_c0_g1_i1:98-955(+)